GRATNAAITRTDARATASATRRRSAGRDQLASLSITLGSRLGRDTLPLRRQHDEREEREEPRQVEVEPVRQHELEADQERGGQRGELAGGLPARQEVRRDGRDREEHLEHALKDVEVGQPRAILPPVPDRERRLAADLPADRPVTEDADGVDRMRVEQQDG